MPSPFVIKGPPSVSYSRLNQRVDFPWKEVAFTVALLVFAFFTLNQVFQTRESMSNSVYSGYKSGVSPCGGSQEDLVFDTEIFAPRGPLLWESLDEVTKSRFLNGTEGLQIMMFDHNKPFVANESGREQATWKAEHIQGLVDKVKNPPETDADPICMHGNSCDKAFFEAFTKYPVRGKHVLILGSQYPWAEAICIAFGAKSILTVDSNPPTVNDSELLKVVHERDVCSDKKFDAIVTFSYLEHDGLGRYGDYIHPNADLERMRKLKSFLKPKGLLYLGVPIGRDRLVFNAHRIYGEFRFPLLITGWKIRSSFGEINWNFSSRGQVQNYPLHVLEVA